MIAIVTGASSGLGALFVDRLLRDYPGLDKIWAIARNKQALEVIKNKYPNKIIALSMDLTQEETIQKLDTYLQQEKPKVKFLVNAAGCGYIGEFADIAKKDHSQLIKLNVEALTSVTHLVLPYMVKNSRILQVASSAAFLPQPHFAVYAASKAYVKNYSVALASEIRSRRIYVTILCPGPMPTAFFKTAEKYEHRAEYKKKFMYDPQKVVDHGMKACQHKKLFATYGISMKIVAFVSRCIPYGVILWMGKRKEKK